MFKSLRNKISIIYFVLVALIIAVGCLSVANIAMIQISISNIMTANYRSIQLSQNMLSVLASQNQSMIGYISSDDNKSSDSFYKNVEVFMLNMTAEEHNISQKGEQSLVNQVNDQYAEFQDTFATLQTLRATHGKEGALDYYNENISPVYSAMAAEISDISLLNQNGLTSSKDQTSRQASGSLYLLFSITILAAIGGFILSRYFSNRFLHPPPAPDRRDKRAESGKVGFKTRH